EAGHRELGVVRLDEDDVLLREEVVNDGDHLEREPFGLRPGEGRHPVAGLSALNFRQRINRGFGGCWPGAGHYPDSGAKPHESTHVQRGYGTTGQSATRL